MRRAPAILLFVALAAPAAASEPLLSGYGGPGDGEQALLGTTIIRDTPATGGGGGTTAPAPTPEALFESAPAPTPTTAPQQTTAPRERPARRPKPARRPRETPNVQNRGPEPPVSSVRPAEPTSAPAPIGGSDLTIALAVLLVALFLAGCARRLAVQAARDRRPQAL